MNLSTFLWKAQRIFFGRYVGKLFYQPRVDKEGNPVRLRKFFGPINQRLMEAGKIVPWILTRQDCIDFWGSVSNDPKYTGNRPDRLARKPGGIVQFLYEFWSPRLILTMSYWNWGAMLGEISNTSANLDIVIYQELKSIKKLLTK